MHGVVWLCGGGGGWVARREVEEAEKGESEKGERREEKDRRVD